MYYYTLIEAIVAAAACILIPICTKKAKNVTYGKLDRAGQITNLVLVAVYLIFSRCTCFSVPLPTPDMTVACFVSSAGLSQF